MYIYIYIYAGDVTYFHVTRMIHVTRTSHVMRMSHVTHSHVTHMSS